MKNPEALTEMIFYRINTRAAKSCWPLLQEDYELLQAAPFAELVPSLIVEGYGCISPFIYGFPHAWSVGFLEQESLADAAETWRATCTAPVATILRSTLQQLAAAGADYYDLFGEMLVTASSVQAAVAAG